jgi:hypothetical protein
MRALSRLLVMIVVMIGAFPVSAQQCNPQGLQFTADASRIDLGTSTTLRWNVQGTSGCNYALTILGRPANDPGAAYTWDSWTSSTEVGAQADGSLQVQPNFDTSYFLVLRVAGQSFTSWAITDVRVNLPRDVTVACFVTPSGVIVCRNAVTINANNLAPLLRQALGTPNTTVIVKNGVELDLSPHLGGPIHIAEGVQLLGERIAEPGKRFQPGPRLFVTPAWFNFNREGCWGPTTICLFKIDGYQVRLSGVRIVGPGEPPDAWREDPTGHGHTIAIHFEEKPCIGKPSTDEGACSSAGSTPTPATINIEIDHNEFSGWASAGVRVFGPRDIGEGQELAGQVWQSWTIRAQSDSSGIHYPPEPEPIRIHDNNFLNNWFGEPYYGYGVDMGLGGHALIERNVFSGYYHAIASDGNFGTGYRAYRNLVLRPGTYERPSWKRDGQAPNEQKFDMHHRRPCDPAKDPACNRDCVPGERVCPAAHDIDIRFNYFYPTTGPAIRLGGWPGLRPYGFAIQSNAFALDANAILLAEERNSALDNVAGLALIGDFTGGLKPADDNLFGQNVDDDAHHSDACDFDGDGINDRLLTTGQTWWYRSGDLSNGWPPWVFLNTSTLLARDVRCVHAGGRVFPGGVGP